MTFIIYLKQILHIRRTKAEIEKVITVEYDVTTYQVKNTIVKTNNTKTATSLSFPELHANKLINQSLHVVDLNIDRYDMIIGRDLIRYLGIDIHGAEMTIHWDDATIPWRDIDYTKKMYLRYRSTTHLSTLKQIE